MHFRFPHHLLLSLIILFSNWSCSSNVEGCLEEGSCGPVINVANYEGSLPDNPFDPFWNGEQSPAPIKIELQICFRTFSYNDPEFLVLALISRIFDDGFTSRLQRILREERGLVYSVECRSTSMSDLGTMDFDVTVRQEKVVEVTRILLKEIKNFCKEGPTAKELAHIKKRYFFDLDSELDDPQRQVVRYAFPHLYSREMSLDEERNIIESISAERMLQVAEKVFDSKRLNLILVGPFTPKLQSQLKELICHF